MLVSYHITKLHHNPEDYNMKTMNFAEGTEINKSQDI